MKPERVQFEISKIESEDIESLKNKCGIETDQELCDNAFILLAWAIEQIEEGNSIASVDEKGGKYHELKMPIFSAVNKL